MLDAVYEECGLAVAAYLGNDAGGISTADPVDASRLIPGMLLDMQNRGQLAAGITSFNQDRRRLLTTHKQLGGVSEVFQLADKPGHAKLMDSLAGSVAIGHIRYSTCGADDVSYAQPLEREHGKPFKWFSFCFNGNVANHQDLATKLVDELGYHLVRPDSDTELFMHYLAFQQRGRSKTPWRKALGSLQRVIDGAWSLALVTADGDLIVARDPSGIKPLCYGFYDGYLVAASESCALQNLGVSDIKDVEPGTMLTIESGELKTLRFAPEKKPAHCFFEWVYFANVASTIDGASVYEARARLGKALAELEEEKVGDDHIVVPVPDTSKAAGDAFAFELGIPSIEGLVRNRYVGRTFIETDDRAAKVRRKFVALRGILEGKKIFLVDDSIVRSTTLNYLISYIRSEGRAAEVHIRIACPPIMSPCFYGIDMSTVGELFAPRYAEQPALRGPLPAETRQQMADAIGADSLNYLPVDKVASALGQPKNHLCLACVNRKYPTPKGQELFDLAMRNHAEGVKGRTTALG
jgi:amidophosphoribosyltransferase